MKKLTVDEVYDIIGHFGFYQVILVSSMAILHFYTCHHMLLNIFVGLELKFSCRTKGEDNLILFNQCPNNVPDNCALEYNSTFRSIAQEWDLVCNKKYMLPLVQSLWMGGVMAGALFLSGTADRFGRLPTLMASIVGTITFEGISAFAPSYWIYVSLRFFGGVCCSLIILVSFVLSQEFVGSSRRSSCGLVFTVYISLGLGAMSLMAAYVADWRSFVFFSSFSGLGLLIIPCILPESPRWLLGQGNLQKSREVLLRMAQLNRTDHLLPQGWELASPNPEGKKGKRAEESLKDLIGHPYVFKLTIIQIYSWFVTSASYYALTMSATSLPGNIYVSTAINGLVEIPASFIGLFAIERFGRRMSICVAMTLSGCACLVIPLLAHLWPLAISTFALIGKLSISATFSLIYIHSGEIFPTVLRNTSLGVLSVAARIGGVIAPFILTLKDIKPNLEYFTLGVLTLFAGLANLKLPETLGQPMPETITDIINMKSTLLPDKSRTKGYAKLMDQEEMGDHFFEDNSEADEDDGNHPLGEEHHKDFLKI